MKKFLTLLIINMVILPLAVNAADYSLSMSCPDTAKAGEKISCNITATANKLSGISAKYTLTTGLEYDDLVIDGGTTYNVNVCNSKGFSLGNTSGLPESFKIGVLKLNIPSNAIANAEYKVSLTDLDGSDMDFNSISGSSVSETIRIKSNNNNLSKLTITGATIEFSNETLVYNVIVNSDKATISAEAVDKNAKITGTGEKSINYGSNKFEIVVTSEMGNQKTYTINVTREDNRSTNNKLSSLVISNTDIIYNNSENYNDDVESSVDSVKITAVAEDNKATIEGTGDKKLNYGLNTFKIVVTAENGEKKTYTIKITREDDRDSDNTLKTLLIGEQNVTINSATTYAVTVGSNVDSVELKATSTSEKSTITGLGTKNLEYGVNNFEITVTAENTKKKVYTISITRTDDTQDNTLKDLLIEGINLNFNGSDTYNIEVENNVSKINVSAVANSEKAKISGIGYHDLEIGLNKILIKVLSASEVEKIYTLNVKRLSEEKVEVPSTSSSMGIIITISIIVFLVIGVVMLVIFYKRNKNKLEII